MRPLVRLVRLLALTFSAALALVNCSGGGGGGAASANAPVPAGGPSNGGNSAPAAGTIYILNGTNQVAAFPPNSGTYPTAQLVFTSSVLSNPTSLVVDAAGRAYVAQSPNIYSFTYASYASQVQVSPATTLTSVGEPVGLALDSSGDLVATDAVNNAVDFFSPGANGAATPLKSIAGGNTQLNAPYQAGFDGAGNLYVLNHSANSVTVYSASSIAGSGTMNVAPIATITSSASAIDDANALVIDSTGKIYVGNGGNTTISVFTNANGPQTPLATLTGGSGGNLKFGCVCQSSLTVDGTNNLYIGGEADPDVLVMSSVTSSSATPAVTMQLPSFTYIRGVSVVP